MTQEAATCHVCGHEIPPSDFQSCHAVILLRRPYCRNCANAVCSSEPRGALAGRRGSVLAGIAGAASLLLVLLYMIFSLGRWGR